MIKILVLSILIFLSYTQEVDDMYSTVEELCEKYGFPYEEHTVHTVDGYIITLNRIPHGANSESQEAGEPLLLIHSLGHSGAYWFVHGPEESPAFFLANQGHDVWVINLRGTVPSMHHETLNWRTDLEYWAYSNYEFNYDWEAAIRYMVETTDYSQVAVMAASYRAANSLMGMATTPEFYHENVSIEILLNPQYRIDFSETPTIRTVAFSEAVGELYEERNSPYFWPPRNSLLGAMTFIVQSYMCEQYPVICMELYNPHTNRAPNTDDIESFRVLSGHMAETTTSRELVHYGQHTRMGMRYFDYGEEENLERYGSEVPPMPDYSSINVPCALVISTSDLYSPPKNVHATLDMLGDNVVFFNIYDYSTYGYLAGQNILDYLEDVQVILEDYPPRHD